MRGLFTNARVFDLASSAYDLITSQSVWRDQIRKSLEVGTSGLAPRHVLDVGCGPGGSTFVLAEDLGGDVEVFGVDYSSKMLQAARRHHTKRYAHLENISFYREDAMDLSFPDNHFDLILGHSFLYLVSDSEAVLNELRRVLRPGGRIVMMEPMEGGRLGTAARRRFDLPESTRRVNFGTLMFWTSMFTWRIVSTAEGRWTSSELRDVFLRAGFINVKIHPTLGGLGAHCVAEH